MNTTTATSEVASACLWVVIVLAVIPWRYVVTQYENAVQAYIEQVPSPTRRLR